MLYSYTWQISKIFYAGTEYPIPNPTIIPEVHKNTTTISSSEIKTQLFNTSAAAISSTSNSQITISEMGGTLSQSPNPDFDTFESNYRNIFSLAPTPKVFDYTITNFGNGTYQLLLTDTNTGNKVYYTATNLSTKTPENKKLSIYPNPATDFIFLKNTENYQGTAEKIQEAFIARDWLAIGEKGIVKPEDAKKIVEMAY
ncbi:hypothetical protein MASR1M29_10360 [Cloacibacterium normanense]